jgi:Concanavalin A-like lectin/glucanases superfamily/Immunoglobulin domain
MKYKPASRFLRHTLMAALLTAGFGLTAQTLTNNLIFYAPFAGGSLDDVAGGLTGHSLSTSTTPTSGGVGGGGYLQLQNDSFNPKQAVWYSDPTPATTDFSFQIWERAPDIDTAQNGQPNNDFAFACTKDWDSGANVGWVLAKNSAAGNPTGLWWNFDATPSGTRVDFRPNYYTNITLFEGVWHQWVVTCQRSGNASFYRDGVLVGTASISANSGKSVRPALGTWITNNILALGEDATLRYDHNTTGGGTAFNGDLDEAAMWGRVLTAEEVAAAYLKGTSGLNVNGSLTPGFAQQPSGGTRYTSDSFLLTCLPADDRGPVTYQWYINGGSLTGATNRNFLLSNLTTNSTGTYTVVANDGVGSITSAPAVLTVLPASQVTAGMAVYLNFDNNIVAQAGTTNSGVAIGYDPTEKYVPGQIGSAATFNNDGSSPVGWSSDWAVSLGDIEWIYTNNWSFSLWVNLTNNLDGGLLGNKDWTSGGNVGWVFAPYNSIEVNYYAAPGPRADIGSFNVRNGQWHHVACVFDRDANTTYVYVDGNRTASASLGLTGWETLTPTSFSPNATLIGSSGDQAYSGAGAIDDLGMWTRSLTADEVLAIYAQGLNGQPLTTAVAGSAIRPLITAQPQSLTLFEGRQAALSVTASGSTPLSYQWYKNGTLLSGATTNSLLYYPVSTNNVGNYTVVITNRYGSVTSAPPATLAVLPITGITSGLAVYLNFDSNIDAQAGTTNSGAPVGNVAVPTYTNGIIGSAANFNNDNADYPPPSDWAVSLGNIEWLYNNSFSFAIWVKTTDTYGGFLGNKDWLHGGNIGWVISEYTANWLNYTAVGAARHDIGNYNWADGNWHHVAATFDRDANRVATYVDGTATSTTNTLGTTGLESLTPTAIMTTLVGSSGNGTESAYGAVDDLGMWMRPLSSQEILAIFVQGYNHQPLTTASTGAIKPFILTPPQAETRAEGLYTGFSANVVGSAPLSYQWRRNGSDLAGETNATLVWPVALSDSGAGFAIVVTNAYGSITSSPPAILTVTPGPASITNSLAVYLNFESNILAQAGTTINGTAIGAVGQEVYTRGQVGLSAASFNNDPYATSPTDWAVSLGDIEWLYTNNWSFSIWVNTTDTYGAALGNKDWASGSNIGWLISEYYTDWLNYRALGAARRDIGDFNWADGAWHHVAAVFYRDGNTVYTYVDGVATAQAPLGVTGTESLTPVAISTTLVGGSGNGDLSLQGAVDDVGMWARPLNQAEIIGIYQAGLTGKGVPQATYPPPSLTATAAGGSITLVYPGWAKSYTLEASSSLAPGSWGTAGAAPSIVNGNSVVTIPVTPGTQFFRLRH